MPTLNVLLQATGKDRGARRLLRDLTALSDRLTRSANDAARAGAKLAGIGGGLPAPGRGRARAAARTRTPSATRGATGSSQREKLSREFDKALERSVRDARKQARALDKQAKAQRRAARNIENLSDAQLEELETQREINRRRRRAARAAAQQRLGPDPTARGGGRGRGMSRGGRAVEFGANLAIAGQEFEQLGAAAEQGVRTAFDAFKDYEKGVVEVSTLTDEIPVDQIRQITQAAAQEFGGLPTDQVSAFYSIVSAGATNAKDAQEQLNAANKLAIGGVATQEEAVLAVSKSVANFGDQFAAGVDPAKEASDSLFTAVKRGQTTVAEMARALPAVAQAASDAGLSLDETNAAIAVLSTRFPSAKEGATALRQAIANISKPTKGAREEAKRLGIDFSVAGIEAAGGIEEFLLKLRAAEKFDEETLAKLFDSTEARAAVSGLISGMDDYRSVLDDMERKQGAADDAFAKMSDTSAQKAKQLEAQMEILKITAGEALVPALTELAEEAGPLIKQMTEWIKANPNLAASLGKVAIAAAVGGRAIGGLTSIVSAGSSAFGLAQSAIDLWSGSTTKAGQVATSTGKMAGGLNAAMGAAPMVFAGATAAILAFNAVLDAAQKPLAEYENTITRIEKQQQDIKFQTPEGRDKSEAELLLERRNRLIEAANAARIMEVEAGGGTAGRELMEGNPRAAFGQAYGAILNRATGAQEEFSRQRTQAELDLARFDQQFGEQIGLSEEQRFTVSEGLFGGGSAVNELVTLLGRQVEATERVAANTTGQPWEGPSMDAGMI